MEDDLELIAKHIFDDAKSDGSDSTKIDTSLSQYLSGQGDKHSEGDRNEEEEEEEEDDEELCQESFISQRIQDFEDVEHFAEDLNSLDESALLQDPEELMQSELDNVDESALSECPTIPEVSVSKKIKNKRRLRKRGPCLRSQKNVTSGKNSVKDELEEDDDEEDEQEDEENSLLPAKRMKEIEDTESFATSLDQETEPQNDDDNFSDSEFSTTPENKIVKKTKVRRKRRGSKRIRKAANVQRSSEELVEKRAEEGEDEEEDEELSNLQEEKIHTTPVKNSKLKRKKSLTRKEQSPSGEDGEEKEKSCTEDKFEEQLPLKRSRKKVKLDFSAYPEPPVETDLEMGFRILKQLVAFPGATAFLDKPDESAYGMEEYYNMITKPIWLNEVMRKYQLDEYKCITELVGDIRRVLENCYQYWGAGDPLSKKALRVEELLEKKLALLPQTLRDMCSLKATHGEDENESRPEEDKSDDQQASEIKRSCQILRKSVFTSSLMQRVVNRTSCGKSSIAPAEAIQEMEKEVEEWESTVLYKGNAAAQICTMWELPVIGHFFYLTLNVLNVGQISQFELERMLLIPQSSTALAKVMTTMLTSPMTRPKLEGGLPMPYSIWTVKLKNKISNWYRVYRAAGDQTVKVFEQLGIEPQFWLVMGETNPLNECQFHELGFIQRVWILKTLCDFLLHNHKTIQEAVSNIEPEELRETYLGRDKQGYTYHYFPEFSDIRIYKQAKVLDNRWIGYEGGLEEVISLAAEDVEYPSDEDQNLDVAFRYKLPRCILPSVTNFVMVAASVEEVRCLIDGFCSQSTPVAPGRGPISPLVQNLMSIVAEVEPIEQKLISSTFYLRRKMHKEWSEYMNRPADFVDSGIIYWEKRENPEKEDKNRDENSEQSVIDQSAERRRERRSKRESKYVFDEINVELGLEGSDESEEYVMNEFDEDSEDEWVACPSKKKKKQNVSQRKIKKLTSLTQQIQSETHQTNASNTHPPTQLISVSNSLMQSGVQLSNVSNALKNCGVQLTPLNIASLQQTTISNATPMMKVEAPGEVRVKQEPGTRPDSNLPTGYSVQQYNDVLQSQPQQYHQQLQQYNQQQQQFYQQQSQPFQQQQHFPTNIKQEVVASNEISQPRPVVKQEYFEDKEEYCDYSKINIKKEMNVSSQTVVKTLVKLTAPVQSQVTVKKSRSPLLNSEIICLSDDDDPDSLPDVKPIIEDVKPVIKTIDCVVNVPLDDRRVAGQQQGVIQKITVPAPQQFVPDVQNQYLAQYPDSNLNVRYTTVRENPVYVDANHQYMTQVRNSPQQVLPATGRTPTNNVMYQRNISPSVAQSPQQKQSPQPSFANMPKKSMMGQQSNSPQTPTRNNNYPYLMNQLQPQQRMQQSPKTPPNNRFVNKSSPQQSKISPVPQQNLMRSPSIRGSRAQNMGSPSMNMSPSARGRPRLNQNTRMPSPMQRGGGSNVSRQPSPQAGKTFGRGVSPQTMRQRSPQVFSQRGASPQTSSYNSPAPSNRMQTTPNKMTPQSSLQARRNLNFNNSPARPAAKPQEPPPLLIINTGGVVSNKNTKTVEGKLLVGLNEDGNYGYFVVLPDGGKVTLTTQQINEVRTKNGGTFPEKVGIPMVLTD